MLYGFSSVTLLFSIHYLLRNSKKGLKHERYFFTQAIKFAICWFLDSGVV
jgi:hypothetical protein